MTLENEWSPEDIIYELKDSEPELLKYLSLMPRELWSKHFAALQSLTEKHRSESKEAVAEMRVNYVLGIIEARENAIVECNTYDHKIKEAFLNSKDQIESLGESLRELLVTKGNLLGYGQTARIKSTRLSESGEPVAVKFLLTPTPKTLSVDGEHEMLYEVETLVNIEDSEERLSSIEHIGVPHPFFYYKRGKLQCYGMSEIHGVTLEEILSDDGGYRPGRDAAVHALKANYASEDKRSHSPPRLTLSCTQYTKYACMAISNQRILWWISVANSI